MSSKSWLLRWAVAFVVIHSSVAAATLPIEKYSLGPCAPQSLSKTQPSRKHKPKHKRLTKSSSRRSRGLPRFMESMRKTIVRIGRNFWFGLHHSVRNFFTTYRDMETSLLPMESILCCVAILGKSEFPDRFKAWQRVVEVNLGRVSKISSEIVSLLSCSLMHPFKKIFRDGEGCMLFQYPLALSVFLSPILEEVTFRWLLHTIWDAGSWLGRKCGLRNTKTKSSWIFVSSVLLGLSHLPNMDSEKLMLPLWFQALPSTHSSLKAAQQQLYQPLAVYQSVRCYYHASQTMLHPLYQTKGLAASIGGHVGWNVGLYLWIQKYAKVGTVAVHGPAMVLKGFQEFASGYPSEYHFVKGKLASVADSWTAKPPIPRTKYSVSVRATPPCPSPPRLANMKRRAGENMKDILSNVQEKNPEDAQHNSEQDGRFAEQLTQSFLELYKKLTGSEED